MNFSVQLVKRLIDVASASVGVMVSLPAMLVIAAAIKLDSRGPVLYHQRRAGMIKGEGRAQFDEFRMYKFRTMIVDAEAATGEVLAEENDGRVTRIGRILRQTRLDELPQLFNVLSGEMSLVGPRPERPSLIKNFSLAIPYFEERMRLLKPGITGLAQISLSYSGGLPQESDIAKLKQTLVNPFELEEAEGAEADDMRTKMLYDFAYSVALEDFREFLRTDLEIILKTPIVMFMHRTGR